MLKILGAHSRLCAIPFESNFAEKWPSPGPEWQKFFGHCDYFTRKMGKSRWVEKTPSHILRLKPILEYFPQGKVVLMLRDGRDVAASYLARSDALEAGLERWVKDNRIGEAFWKHPHVYVVRYENIVTDFEKTIRDLITFLGEEFEEALVNYYANATYFCSSRIAKPPNSFGGNLVLYRNWQINQPLFDGRGRWHDLKDEEKKLIKDKAGDVLIKYGYATDLNW
jgi:hypothetical protein